MRSRITTRLWRRVCVTVFALALFGCKGADMSHNPKVVDRITVDYLVTTFPERLIESDSTLVAVEKVKITRQDYIPVALIDCRWIDGTTSRTCYHFSYDDICRVREAIEQGKLSITELASELQTSQMHIAAMVDIINLAKRAPKE